MSENVNRGLQAARVAETEDKILRSATELFLQRGYAGTTLTAVAEHAQVGARTVYVRFGTKAALLKRAVDVAIVGDTAPIDISGREWFTTATTAPTPEERIEAVARGGRELLARAGDIMAVALKAVDLEPELAAASDAGRKATREHMRHFWSRMAADGLLPAGSDLDWLTDTTALIVHAETYMLSRQMIGWDLDAYERWVTTSLKRLMATAGLPG